MPLETFLGFRAPDQTYSINTRLSGLISKGILKGGIVTPEPASLQIRIVGTAGEDVVMMAFASDGMMVREQSEEHVLSVTAGITNVVCLRAKYLESQPPLVVFQVLTLGDYETDPDPDSLIRLAAVTPAAGATAVADTDINGSYRDSIEGFTRRIVREVVQTQADLPAVSGSPASANINFLNNNFVDNTTITVGSTSLTEQFTLVQPISFAIANPTVPGVSRVNPSQVTIVTASQVSSGTVTVVTATPHGFSSNEQVRISGNSALGANGLRVVSGVADAYTFMFSLPPVAVPFHGTGGNAVDQTTPVLVTVQTAPGVIENITPGMQVSLSGVIDSTFNGIGTVTATPTTQKFEYYQVGYPTAVSGGGIVTKVGYSLPPNAVPIGSGTSDTAKNFVSVFMQSDLAPDILAVPIGGSILLTATTVGAFGNAYTLASNEPGNIPANSSIVLSGSTFMGGADPVQSLANAIDLKSGDVYVVLQGEADSMELWGYNGTRFVDLTSSSTATLLDFHRRNLLTNEKHLTDNQQAALVGTVGTPSATNPFVTAQDTSVLTTDLTAALEGADGVPPSGSNRFLTEARYRGERAGVIVPSSQTYVELPLGERWVVGGQVATNTVTIAIGTPPLVSFTGHGFSVGTAVYFSTTGELPSGMNPATVYYVSSVGVADFVNEFSLSSTPDGNTLIITSGSQTGEQTLHSPDAGPLQYFNVVFTSTLGTAGGPSEYTNIDFSPVTVVGLYTDAALTVPLNTLDPIHGSDAFGIFPQLDAAALGYPTTLYVKLSAVPNNGSCTVLYSKAMQERYRIPTVDTLCGPQRIIPAELRDIINKVAELRFNAGIGVVGSTSVQFPADMFVASNVQNLTFRRTAGNKFITLADAFTVNFTAGTGTTGIVNTFTPIAYGSGGFTTGGMWTRYLLMIDRNSKIKVVPVSSLLEHSIDPAFATTLAGVAYPSIVNRDGSYVFASVGVQSNSANTDLNTILMTSIELYPYQGTNSLPIDLPIVCGDGTTSFGHFTGIDSIQRAINWSDPGHIIVIQPGTYSTALTVTKSDITLVAESGAYLTCPNGTALTISADRFRGQDLRFKNCYTAISIPVPVSDLELKDPVFEYNSISLRAFACSSTLYNSSLNTTPVLQSVATNATWTVTDGSGGKYIGCFNSPDGINQALAYAHPGDEILVYPGSYSSVTWTKSNVTMRGLGGAQVLINGATGGTGSCLIVTGSGNQFSNITLTNGAFGIECQIGSTYNRFDNTVSFTSSVVNPVSFPITGGVRHNNYHPIASGTDQYVTVGDGSSSWGDYVGPSAINLALSNESAGLVRKIVVKPGTYIPINTGGMFSGFEIVGSGIQSVIQATAPADQCILIRGDKNKVSKFFLRAINNNLPAVNYGTLGIQIDGRENIFEDIWFEESDEGTKITPNKKWYDSTGGGRNRFIPPTGYPTRFTSWVVGDGRRSFGEFNGANGIEAAIGALSAFPRGTAGTVTLSSGSTCTFTDTNPNAPYTFTQADLYRYLSIAMPSSDPDTGNFQITALAGSYSVTLKRFDGGTFQNESNLFWNLLTGSKLTVLPGTYSPFTIQSGKNDIDIEAWSQGDSLIAGSPTDSTLVTLNGNRCRIAGFRFVGGSAGAYSVTLNGVDNIFEHNRYETTNRFSIASTAINNKIFDAPENYQKTAYTVSAYPSRADFVGSTQAALAAAITAATNDPHIKKIIVGAGSYTFSSTVYVPANLTIEGVGYGTQFIGNGLFPALTLGESITFTGTQAIPTLLTTTGTVSNGSTSITSVANVTGVAAGYMVVGGNIPVGTYVISVVGSTVTMSAAATGNSTGNQTITGINFNTFSDALFGPATKVLVYGNWMTLATINANVTGVILMNQ